MNIYVGNLSWSMTDSDLNDLFIQFGTVSSAKILKDKMSGRSKGFGFVEMENDEEAKAAIANLNETEIQGRKIVVNESQPRPEGEFKNALVVLAAAVIVAAAAEAVAVTVAAAEVVAVVMAVETVVATAATENQEIINQLSVIK